jgi:micrococcal nuclease
MKRLAVVFLAFTALLSGCGSVDLSAVPKLGAIAPAPGYGAQASRMVDGDTLRLVNGDSVRILGIDSPETKDPRKPVQCGGPESSAWAREQIPPNAAVRIVADPTQDQKDRYNRVLAYVLYKRGTEWLDFSVESARAGMSRAYVYDKKVQEYDKILAAEAEARSAKRGLWSHC